MGYFVLVIWPSQCCAIDWFCYDYRPRLRERRKLWRRRKKNGSSGACFAVTLADTSPLVRNGKKVKRTEKEKYLYRYILAPLCYLQPLRSILQFNEFRYRVGALKPKRKKKAIKIRKWSGALALAHESRKKGNLKLAVKSRGENLVAFLPISCDEGGGKEITCCLDFFLLFFYRLPRCGNLKKRWKKNNSSSSSLVSGFW